LILQIPTLAGNPNPGFSPVFVLTEVFQDVCDISGFLYQKQTLIFGVMGMRTAITGPFLVQMKIDNDLSGFFFNVGVKSGIIGAAGSFYKSGFFGSAMSAKQSITGAAHQIGWRLICF
jgi:hypothetical protein